MKCFAKGPLGNKSTLVWITACYETDEKPLPEPKIV